MNLLASMRFSAEETSYGCFPKSILKWANQASSVPARKLAFEPVGKPRSFTLSATTRRTTTQVGGVAMADPQSFLDNLRNLRLVLSVALEHTQQNRNQFLKSTTPQQFRQAELSISKHRTLA